MNKSLLRRLFFSVLLLAAAASGLRAQRTWPVAYPLSGGNYFFTYWPAASVAGTYPAAMIFYRLDTMNDPTRIDTIYQNYTAAYNITSGTCINGLDSNGFSFINTGNAVYKVGAAVLAVSTTNRNTVQVTWTGKTVTPNLRTYEIRLYYRTDSVSAFLPVLNGTDTVKYVRSNNANDSLVLGPVTLPAAVNNKPYVQLCWKYFQSDTTTATGARAELSVNHIRVTSLGIPSPSVSVSASAITAFLTYVNIASAPDTFTVSGANLTAANVTVTAPTGFELSTSATGTYSSSLTLTQTGGALANTIIYVRFHPTSHGIFTGNVSIASTGAFTQTFSVTGTTVNATNPAAFMLSISPYFMHQWDSLAPANTYPANMVFHTTNVADQPFTTGPMLNNWTCGYNIQSRPRVLGLSADGFAFINTGNPQYDSCNGNTTVLNTYVGAAVLAVNTVGTANIVLLYTAGLVAQGDGATPRVYNIRLQYRTDTTANFTDLNMEYSSAAKTDGNVQAFTYFLPATLQGLPYLQFRWLYYAINISGASGSRPELRVDDIFVGQGEGVGGTVAGATAITAYPNPVASDGAVYFTKNVSGVVYDMYGRVVRTLENITAMPVTNMAPGIYTAVLRTGTAIRIVVQ